MRDEFIQLLRCPNTGEELKLYALSNTANEVKELTDEGLQMIKKECLKNDLSKVLFNTSLSFIYPIIEEIPMLDTSKAYSIKATN
tara:strand:- start:11 stop:265 length:255 start_codon:yes stop_codon:yes gene_type:complete